MAEFYQPPNPYGSYFAFDSRSMMLPMNYGPDARMSSGVAMMMGQTTSYNPTAVEMANQNMRNMTYQRYMADMFRTDRRIEGISNVAQKLLFGDNAELRSRGVASMGGQQAFNQGIGSMLNMSPLGSMLGGNFGSLATGALSAVTSGNLNFGGNSFNGDGLMQVNMARTLMTRVRQQFTNANNGMPNLSATSGLNLDQIGGIMGIGASQGAFSGLNVTKMNDKGRMVPDDSTLNKMTDFTKKAAKAVGVLMDVFGPGPLADQLNRMQQITGLDLSRLDNPGAMHAKLNALRITADKLGIMPQQMMNMAAQSNQFMAANGMPLGIGDLVAMDSASAYTTQRFQQSSMVRNPLTMGQMQHLGTANAMGMSMDPMEAVVNATIVAGQNRGLKGQALRDLANRASLAGSERGLGGMYNFFQNEFGMNAPGFIQSQGGTTGIFTQLLPENKNIAHQLGARELEKRGFVSLKYALSNSGFRNATQMSSLMEGMSGKALEDLAYMYKKGTSDEVMLAAIKEDIDSTEDPHKYLKDLKTFSPETVLERVGAAQNIKNSNQALSNYQRDMDRAKQILTPTMVDIRGTRGTMTQNSFMMGVLGGLSGAGSNSYMYMEGNLPSKVAKGVNLNAKTNKELSYTFSELLRITAASEDSDARDALTRFGIDESVLNNDTKLNALRLKMKDSSQAEELKSHFDLYKDKRSKGDTYNMTLTSTREKVDDAVKKARSMGIALSAMKAAGVDEGNSMYQRMLRAQKYAMAEMDGVVLNEKQKTVLDNTLGMWAGGEYTTKLNLKQVQQLMEDQPHAAEGILQNLQSRMVADDFKTPLEKKETEKLIENLKGQGVGAGPGTSILSGKLVFEPDSLGLALKNALIKENK